MPSSVITDHDSRAKNLEHRPRQLALVQAEDPAAPVASQATAVSGLVMGASDRAASDWQWHVEMPETHVHKQGYACIFAYANPEHYGNRAVKTNCSSPTGFTTLATFRQHMTAEHLRCLKCWGKLRLLCETDNTKKVDIRNPLAWVLADEHHKSICEPKEPTSCQKRCMAEPFTEQQRYLWALLVRPERKLNLTPEEERAWVLYDSRYPQKKSADFQKFLRDEYPQRQDEHKDDWEWRRIYFAFHPDQDAKHDPRRDPNPRRQFWWSSHDAVLMAFAIYDQETERTADANKDDPELQVLIGKAAERTGGIVDSGFYSNNAEIKGPVFLAAECESFQALLSHEESRPSAAQRESLRALNSDIFALTDPTAPGGLLHDQAVKDAGGYVQKLTDKFDYDGCDGAACSQEDEGSSQYDQDVARCIDSRSRPLG